MAIYVEYDRDGDVVIWTNPEPGDRHSGRCIGVGKTFAEAKADAVSELHGDMAALDALTGEEGE